MIIVALTGGLGNQLFQYAAARALADMHGTQLKLDIDAFDRCPLRAYCLNNFNIQAERTTIRDIIRFDKTEGLMRLLKSISPKMYSVFHTAAQKTGRYRFTTRYYAHELGSPLPPLLIKRIASQRIFHFDDDFFNLPNDIILIGTWISYKYFDHIRPILINEFSVKHELRDQNFKLAHHIKNSQSVSIHVRRTDKLNNSEYFSTELSYLNNAMTVFKKILKDPLFYVFSDDIVWCKENIQENNTVFIDWNDDAHAYEDLRLMSLCKHNIIAESSFSWWGAYLNTNHEKVVITPPPSRWVNRKNSLCKDILPSEWKIFE